AAEGALVDFGLVDEGVEVGGGAGAGGPVGAAPAVAGGVDEHADGGRESGVDQVGVHGLVVGQLVDVGVVLVEVRRVDRLAVDGLGRGHVGLADRRGVGGVADESVHAGHARGGAGGDGLEQVHRGAHVGWPAQPCGVGDVDVVVDVGDRVQL